MVNTPDEEVLTPLDHAINLANIRMVRLLLANGADVKQIKTLGSLVSENDLDMVKLLVKLGANVNIRDGNGQTPMELCLNGIWFLQKYNGNKNTIERKKKICDFLEQHGAQYSEENLVKNKTEIKEKER